MGLLNIWLSKALAEGDREEQRKYQENKEIEAAQGRAAYASSLLGDSGWQEWSPDGSLGAPSGYPAALGTVPDSNAWRFAPQESAQTVNNILEYKQRPVIADQMSAIALKNEGAKKDFERNAFMKDVSSLYSPEDATRRWAMKTAGVGSEAELSSDITQRAAQNTGLLPSIATQATQTQDIEAQQKLAQAKEEQRLAIGLQRARDAAANLRANTADKGVSAIGDEALLKNPRAIGDTAVAGQNYRQAHFRFPQLAAPTGSTWEIAPTGDMSMVKMPGFEDSMGGMLGSGNPVLDTIASDFPKKPSTEFSVAGTRQAMSPVVAAAGAVPAKPQPVTAPVVGDLSYGRLPIAQRIGAFLTHPEYGSGSYPGDAKAAADFKKWEDKWFRTPEERFADRVAEAQGLPTIADKRRLAKKQAEENYKRQVFVPFFQPQ